MEDEAIFIYCLADCIVKSTYISDHPQSQMTQAEIITFVMISALYYRCNYAITNKVVTCFKYFKHPISHSRLIRRIHQIPHFIWQVMFILCKMVLKAEKSKKFIIDSFPVAACQNNKIFRCKLFTSDKYRGYTASKKSYFFGIKVHMTVSEDGIPIEFLLTPGSVADVTALKYFHFNFAKGTKIYGDGAYNTQKFEAFLRETSGITLIPKRRRNSKRKNTSEDEFFLRFRRGRIETTFSEITSLMPRSIQAKTAKGFLLKVLFFVLGYTLKRLLKEA